ncbi:MAG: sensor histidine kinase [Methylocystaceae bacterium]|nr:MAG: sensor histidine kinase [Methylocystaceae bacterium]
MKPHRSLTLRLLAYLLIAQLAALVLQPLTEVAISISGLDPYWDISLNDWGEYRAQALVVRALTKDPDGAIRLEQTEAIELYRSKHPGFRYAAFDPRSAAAVPGSSPELVAALGNFGGIEASSLRFHFSAAPDPSTRGFLRRSVTPFGTVAIVASGYRFEWRDLALVAGLFLTPHSLVVISPMLLAAVAITWFVVWRGLAPLRDTARSLARIDMNSLDQRISSKGAPAEVAPFLDALNEALSRLDAGVEAQRRFIANAAHELRTPIAIMRAHADNPDEATFRRDVKRDIRRIQTLAEQLLVTARIFNSASAAREEIDLVATALAVVADYMPLVYESKRLMAFESAVRSVVVHAHRLAIESVVGNLINNAMRAEPEGGTVLVRVGPGAMVEVIDHGAGVPAADRETIFEPFWRGSEATRGAGLGLAIAKELIDAHKGHIWVEDTPGGGATFKIFLG